MINTIEIQIFVSNPSDVEPEKKIIEKVCSQINDRMIETNNNVRYAVKEWKKLLPQFDGNPQLKIEEIVGKYDVYIGILWKKFGSPTGIKNESTGKEYGSGTEREFYVAYENFKNYGIPEMYLFYKRQSTKDLYDENAHNEFQRILEFKKINQSKGSHIEFPRKEIFKEIIYNLLYPKALLLCVEAARDKKIEYVQKYR
jgi:hypothetical protein